MRAPTSRSSRRDRAHRGFTLIELLVVVTIVLMLFGLAATVMQPMREGRDVREAARMVNAYLGKAQTRAIQRGRLVGVWIRRLPLQPNISLELAMAELPPPYGGDVLGAKIMVTGAASAEYNRDTADPRFFHVGNLIRFDYKGPLRIIKAADPQSGIIGFLPVFRLTPIRPVPYQVYGFPREDPEDDDPDSLRIQAPSAVQPLILPASVAIDVANSGIGKGWFAEFDATEPATTIDPMILFGPDGSVDYVIAGLYDGSGEDLEVGTNRPLSTIHLLIGRPEKLGTGNLADANNLWVSIDKATGKVTTSDIFPPNPQKIQDFNNGIILKSELLRDARSFATAGLSNSGG